MSCIENGIEMNKLIPLEIDGQKLVQLSQLTIDQANDLRSWLPADSLRMVAYQGIELLDCISFEVYDYWFKSNHVLSRNYETILDF